MRLTGFWMPLKSVATIKCTTFIAGERKNAIKTQHKMKKYLTIVEGTLLLLLLSLLHHFECDAPTK